MVTPKQGASRLILNRLIDMQSAAYAGNLDSEELLELMEQSSISDKKKKQVEEFVIKLTDKLIERFSNTAGFK
ncbi:MAG: hypothetical protein WCS15_00180 [Prevotella sp.]|nr:hypothetical protein [Massilibacteroides sp.]